jgi:predicted nucleic acid-binding protein
LSIFFVDTSTLAKRYVMEVGSAWVHGWVQPAAGNVVVISDLTTVEMISVLARRAREGNLSATVEGSLSSVFLLHVEKEYLSVPIDVQVLIFARTFARKHGLRTLDAVQLGCAKHALALLNEPITFVCADNKLLTAAAAEGFASISHIRLRFVVKPEKAVWGKITPNWHQAQWALKPTL